MGRGCLSEAESAEGRSVLFCLPVAEMFLRVCTKGYILMPQGGPDFFTLWVIKVRDLCSCALSCFQAYFEQCGFLPNASGGLTPLSPPSELQEIPVTIREQSGVLCFHSRGMPVSPVASGMQPRDPCRPWRGTLASGHKPR